MSGQSSNSKLSFFKGQKELGSALFAPGGPFANLLSGAQDPRFENSVAQGKSALNEDLASRGLADSPLGARAVVDLQSQAASGRESNRMETLLKAVQPIGTTSKSGGGGLCLVADEMFGLGSLKAMRARAYAQTHDNWFLRIYGQHVNQWAEWVRAHPYLSIPFRPIWMWMAWRGN
jgi:hypothetical protein